MPFLFRKLFARKQTALTGAPPIRRLKTYSAQSGYVYQYFYEGHRQLSQSTEFVFSVSHDRKSWHPVSALLADSAVAAWEQVHGRSLSAPERYAVAKLALFQAFDEREDPAQMREAVAIEAHDVETISAALDL